MFLAPDSISYGNLACESHSFPHLLGGTKFELAERQAVWPISLQKCWHQLPPILYLLALCLLILGNRNHCSWWPWEKKHGQIAACLCSHVLNHGDTCFWCSGLGRAGVRETPEVNGNGPCPRPWCHMRYLLK